MDTSAIDKIRNRYNPEHDLGPDAPVQWSVMELAELVEKLSKKVDELEQKLEQGNRLPDSIQEALNSGDGVYRP